MPASTPQAAPPSHFEGSWAQESQLADAARALAPHLRAGDCIALQGPMGAGKTTFSRALCQALGVDVAETFGSPTYAYANVYEARDFPVVHADLYRVESAEQAEALGLAEQLLDPHAVIIVEWADRHPEFIAADALWIALCVDWDHPSRRTFHLSGPADKVSAWITAFS